MFDHFEREYAVKLDVLMSEFFGVDMAVVDVEARVMRMLPCRFDGISAGVNRRDGSAEMRLGFGDKSAATANVQQT